jgi:hypothetical protein
MKNYLLSQKWWILGSVFAGLSMACAAKQGAIDYTADHVWETADKINLDECAGTPTPKE